MITFCFSPPFSITYLKLSLVFPTPSSLLEAAVTVIFKKNLLIAVEYFDKVVLNKLTERINMLYIELPAIFHSISDRFSKTKLLFDTFSS